MPKFKKAYAWKQDGKVTLSLLPRAAKGPVNQYDTEAGALRDAQSRKMTLVWEEAEA